MVDHPENDPRVEIVKYELAKMLGYTPDGATNRAVKLLDAVDAVDPLRATPHPPPGDIVVTEEMLDRALDQAYGASHWKECSPTEVENVRAWMSKAISVAMCALDPRNRAVEPVAGDAVEAALDEYENKSDITYESGEEPFDWRRSQFADESRDRMLRTIAAADHVRGRAYVTWRRPEEYKQLPRGADSKLIVLDCGSYRNASWSDEPLPTEALAWCEMPSSQWVSPARTATDGERAPDPVQAALTQAWHIAKDGCLLPPDGGSPTTAEYAVSTRIANRIRAMMPDSPLPELASEPPAAAAIPPDGRYLSRPATGESPALSRQERIDETIAACTECGSWGFPRRSDCESCTAVVDAEIAHETPGAAVLAGSETWKCGARNQGYTGADYPAECNWPLCSCDPYANKVIAALDECGAIASPAPIPAQPPLADIPEAPAVVWTAAAAHALNMVLCQMRDDAIRGHRRDEAKNIEDARVAAFPSAAPAWPPADCKSPSTCGYHKVCCNGWNNCPHAKREEAGNV